MGKTISRYSIIVTLLIGGVIILLVLNFLDIFKPIRFLFTPLEKFTKTTLSSEDPVQCTKDLKEALASITNLKSVEDENSQLRNLLNFHDNIELSYIVANVLSYDPQSPSLIYIDKGTIDGINENQAVVADDGIIVGKILTANTRTSIVQLLISGASKLAVKSIGDASASGLLKGYLGNALQMEYILDESEIIIGDMIVTSGLEPLIPAGLIIGRVQSIDEKSDQLFKTATIEPLTDLSSLRIISVVKAI